MGSGSTLVNRVADVVGNHGYRWAAEFDLQRSIFRALIDAGLSPIREWQIAPGCRPDVWVPAGKIAVEVKRAGTTRETQRQLQRYADSGLVAELVLVTTVAAHRDVDRTLSTADGLVAVRVVTIGDRP